MLENQNRVVLSTTWLSLQKTVSILFIQKNMAKIGIPKKKIERVRERERKISSRNIISNLDDLGEVRTTEDGSADSRFHRTVELQKRGFWIHNFIELRNDDRERNRGFLIFRY